MLVEIVIEKMQLLVDDDEVDDIVHLDAKFDELDEVE